MKDINLIPSYYIEAKKRKKKKIRLALVCCAALVAIFAAIGYPIWVRHTLAVRSESLMEEISRISGYAEIDRQFRLIEDMYAKREKLASSLRDYGIDVALMLERLSEASPENLFILNLNTSKTRDGNQEITLDGVARSEDDIATFVMNLRKDGYFSNVVVSSVLKNESPAPEYSFSISVICGRGE